MHKVVREVVLEVQTASIASVVMQEVVERES